MLIYVLRAEKNQKEPGRTKYKSRFWPFCTPNSRLKVTTRANLVLRIAKTDRQIWWKTAKQQNKFGGKRQNDKINLVEKKKRPTFTSKFKDYGKGYNMLQEKDV